MGILKAESYQKSKWKNGLGITEQIYIYPPYSSVVENNFDFRISVANIDGAGPFSIFPGYKRLLMVLEGKGILLSTANKFQRLYKFDSLEFDGITNYFSDLLDGPIKDFNLIWNPNRIVVEHKILSLAKDTVHFFSAEDCIKFYIILDGAMKLESTEISKWDCLILEDHQSVNCLAGLDEVKALHMIVRILS